jgi:hypothetical protein
MAWPFFSSQRFLKPVTTRRKCGPRRQTRLEVEGLEERVVPSWLTVIVHGQADSADSAWVSTIAASINSEINSNIEQQADKCSLSTMQVSIKSDDDAVAVHRKVHDNSNQLLNFASGGPTHCSRFLLVDWEEAHGPPINPVQAGKADEIGARLGLLIGHIFHHSSLLDKVHLVGFSRGSFVVSTAAAVLNGFKDSPELRFGWSGVTKGQVDTFIANLGIEKPSSIYLTTMDHQPFDDLAFGVDGDGLDSDGIVARWGVQRWENYFQTSDCRTASLAQGHALSGALNIDLTKTRFIDRETWACERHGGVHDWYWRAIIDHERSLENLWIGATINGQPILKTPPDPPVPVLGQIGFVAPIVKSDLPPGVFREVAGTETVRPVPATIRDDYSNAPGSATGIDLGTSFSRTLTGSIDYAGDRDWFKVRTLRDGNLKVETGTVGSRLNSYVAVYDASLKQIRADTAGGAGTAAQVVLTNVRANQTYFIEVAGVGTSTGSYQLLVSQPSTAPLPDPAAQPGQTRVFSDAAGSNCATAKPVTLDRNNKGDDAGRISPKDDVDMYHFVATATGQIEADIIPDSGLTTFVSLYNGSCQPMDTDSSSNDGISHFLANVIAGRNYYLKIESENRASTGVYELHIRPYDGANAPGGSGTDGPPGPLPGWGGVRGVQITLSNGNGSSRGSINNPGDVGWFQIDNALAGNMQVVVAGTNDDLTEFITVFKADGGGIDSDSGDNDGIARSCFSVSANQRIIVAAASHERRSTGPYTITITQPASCPDDDHPDLGETPRDLSGDITQEGSGFVRGRMETSGDTDIFAIPVRGSGYFNVQVSQANSTLVGFLRLSRTPDTGGLFESDDGRDGVAQVGLLPEPGLSTVYAIVSGLDGTQGPYVMNVWRAPNPDDDHPNSCGAYCAPFRLDTPIVIHGRNEHPRDIDSFRFLASRPGPVGVLVISQTSGFTPFMHQSWQTPDFQGTQNTDGGSGRGGRTFNIISNVMDAPHNWVNVEISGSGSHPYGDYILYVWQPGDSRDFDPDTVGIEASPILLDGSGNGSLDGSPNGDEERPAIEYVGDVDVFQMQAVADRQITFQIDGSVGSIGTFLTVYDVSGRPIASDHMSGPGQTSLITLEAERGQLFYLEVRSFTVA